jgi:hypothetical protein
MCIVFCKEVSSMGKKFENNEEGKKRMGEYIFECLIKYPEAEIIIKNWI